MSFDRRDLLIAVALFFLALVVNLSHIAGTEFHRDEARWIHRARFVEQLANPVGPYWQERDLLRGQPPVGSYLMGIGLMAQGRDLATNGLWNFNFGERWNRRHGRMPSMADLVAARRTNAFVGALIAATIFGIGRRLSGRLAGIVAALMLIFHPLSIYLSSLAGSDAVLTLLVALATLAAITLADRPTWGRSLLLGALLGLGGAAKLSPLLLAVPLGGLGLLLAWAGWRRRDGVATALGWRLLPLPIVAVATFIASYPYLWPDPVRRSVLLFTFRAREMASQGQIWDDLNVTSRADALSRVGRWLGEEFSTTGSLASWVAGRLGLAWEPAGIDLLLALAGGLVLAATTLRGGWRSRHLLAVVVLGGQVAAIVLGMRADFERYLYPVVLAEMLGVGILIGSVGAVVGFSLRVLGWSGLGWSRQAWKRDKLGGSGPLVAERQPVSAEALPLGGPWLTGGDGR